MADAGSQRPPAASRPLSQRFWGAAAATGTALAHAWDRGKGQGMGTPDAHWRTAALASSYSVAGAD